MTRPSDFLLIFLRQFERFRGEPYRDQGGKWTIGYGHLITATEAFDRITPEEGERLMALDLRSVCESFDRLVTAPLLQCEQDAVLSLIFNIGQTAFSTSTIRDLLNRHDTHGAAREFRRWHNVEGKFSGGLMRRRIAEELRFLGGHELSVLDITDNMTWVAKAPGGTPDANRQV